ncbi:hypothetical protein BKA66DRAFT_511738 [Pyrenochaeta sp. MPI-SDFR-AT-0127]|nr:hypothetical protein BKA66DRAFT_511738 [Pyrenochaeta sp. MPI-SDFR-AT-0127]
MALDPLPSNTQAILRAGAEAVAYHIPIAPPSTTNPVLKSTVALPSRSQWTSGLHYHTMHTEYLRLIKGSIFVELDGELKFFSAKAGGEVSWRTGELLTSGLELKVDRYARHNWGRAEVRLVSRRLGLHVKIVSPEDRDEEVIVEEWTDPADITKPLFFWNLNGVITGIQDAPLSRKQSLVEVVLGNWWIPFQLFIIFWDLDNWPVFVSVRNLGLPFLGEHMDRCFGRLVEHVMTFMVLFAAKFVGTITGTRAIAQDRTPNDLWNAYKQTRL